MGWKACLENLTEKMATKLKIKVKISKSANVFNGAIATMVWRNTNRQYRGCASIKITNTSSL